MRTTVTLDRDVEKALRDAMHRTRRSFKQTLNEALRAALGKQPPPLGRKRFTIKARPLQLRPGFDPAGFNALADELELSRPPSDSARSRRA